MSAHARAGRAYELFILLAFFAWAARFVSRASFLAVDRLRYGGMFDDAYISMRYGWNLAHGAGLVWNPGERVEGYSNLLTTLLMAAACAIFDRRIAVFAMQWAGVATVLVTGILVARLASRFDPPSSEPSPGRSALALVFALAFYPLWYWSLSGMETGLVALLFCAALWAVEKWRETGRSRHWAGAGAAMGLLCVARPDGVLLSGIAFLCFAHAAYEREGRSAFRRLLALAGIAALFPLAQLGFRLAYYGSAVPNTYVLKLGGFPLSARVPGGLRFVSPFLPVLLTLLLAMAASLVRHPSRLKAAAISALVVLTAYQVLVGGDPWPYWRIMVPAIPLAAALAVHEVWAWIRKAGGDRVPRAARLLLVGALLAALVAGLNWQFRDEASLSRRPYQWESNLRNVNTAIALNELLAPSASVGVFWAGAIPYYTSLRAVDFLGKCDPMIARRGPDLSGAIAWSGMSSVPGHNKYDLRYSIVSLRPTYVQGFKWGRDDLSGWARAVYDSIDYRGVSLWLRRDAGVAPDLSRSEGPRGPG